MRKRISLDDDLILAIDNLRGKEKPKPSFSAMLGRLVWKGLSDYQQPVKYCDYCGRKTGSSKQKFCDRCGVSFG